MGSNEKNQEELELELELELDMGTNKAQEDTCDLLRIHRENIEMLEKRVEENMKHLDQEENEEYERQEERKRIKLKEEKKERIMIENMK